MQTPEVGHHTVGRFLPPSAKIRTVVQPPMAARDSARWPNSHERSPLNQVLVRVITGTVIK
jgi:hypothetical protein